MENTHISINKRTQEIALKLQNQHGTARLRATEYKETNEKLMLYHKGKYVGGIDQTEVWTVNNNEAQVSIKARLDLDQIKEKLKTTEQSSYHDRSE